jgi:hypothetical protein
MDLSERTSLPTLSETLKGLKLRSFVGGDRSWVVIQSVGFDAFADGEPYNAVQGRRERWHKFQELL